MAGIKDRIVKVALGKAHGVILTEKGSVYTFGINNKGQCGRDLSSSSVTQSKQSGNSVSLQKAALLASCKEPLDDEAESEDSGSAIETKLCAPEEHRWSVDQCMICTQCGQCTVNYSSMGTFTWRYALVLLRRVLDLHASIQIVRVDCLERFADVALGKLVAPYAEFVEHAQEFRVTMP